MTPRIRKGQNRGEDHEPAITEDYSSFHPSVYLDEYYSSISRENEFLLKFYHEAYGRIGRCETLLEIGGGPTIYQLISASSSVSKIVFSEFLEVNRAEVRRWLNRDPGSFQWDDYFDFVARLEARNGNPSDPALIEARLRTIIEIVHCDLNNQNPLAPAEHEPFDIVSSAFCIEGVRNNASAFRTYLYNSVSQIKDRGALVCAMVKECERYKVGTHYFPAFSANERSMHKLLTEAGLHSIEINTFPSDGSQGYSGIMGITAIKRT